MERLLLRPAELAEAIGVSRSKAYELIASGEIPSIKLGGSVRVPVEALKAWIKSKVNGRSIEDSIDNEIERAFTEVNTIIIPPGGKH